MVDEFKSIRENLLRVLIGKGGEEAPETPSRDQATDEGGFGFSSLEAGAARALIQTFFARAGKSKDDVVQIVAREIGMAVAAMLKEPLNQLAKHQKLQISFEFVPKTGAAKSGAKSSPTAARGTDGPGNADRPKEAPAASKKTATRRRRAAP